MYPDSPQLNSDIIRPGANGLYGGTRRPKSAGYQIDTKAVTEEIRSEREHKDRKAKEAKEMVAAYLKDNK